MAINPANLYTPHTPLTLKTIKIKTADLAGAALDWAVAKCEGITPLIYPYKYHAGAALYPHAVATIPLEYSANWSQGGPIIEREGVKLEPLSPVGDGRNWRAALEWLDEPHGEGYGPIPLIAAMRCYVASKLGDEVEVPEELA